MGRVRFVIDDEYTHVLQDFHRAKWLHLSFLEKDGFGGSALSGNISRYQRQADRKSRATVFSFAVYFNRPLMQVHQVPNNRETQSQSTMFTGSRSVGLAKSIEDKRDELFVDSDAVVSYRYANSPILYRGRHPHLAAASAKLHRITEQVPKDLLQAVWVAHYGRLCRLDREFKANLFRFCDRTRRVMRRLDHICEIDNRAVDLQLAGDDSRDVEQVVDQLRLRFSVAFDGVDRPSDFILIELVRAQQVTPPKNCRQRCAQLMR